MDLTAAIEAATVALWGPVPGAKGGMFDARIVAEAAVRAAAPLIERAVRREGICGDPAPTLIRTEDGQESGAGVICELTHGHRSEWHEAPSHDPFLPPMRWRNTSVGLAGIWDGEHG